MISSDNAACVGGVRAASARFFWARRVREPTSSDNSGASSRPLHCDFRTHKTPQKWLIRRTFSLKNFTPEFRRFSRDAASSFRFPCICRGTTRNAAGITGLESRDVFAAFRGQRPGRFS